MNSALGIKLLFLKVENRDTTAIKMLISLYVLALFHGI